VPDPLFTSLRETIASSSVPLVFERLIDGLRAERKLPQLFEAMLMRKRHELGLPLEGTESIKDIPAEHQEQVEQYYVEVCRTVGKLFLEKGDIAGAWPYLRAIDEPRDVAAAIAAWSPPEGWDRYQPGAPSDGYDQLDAIIDISFHQGANPIRGYELILRHYGTCRAITTIEHQFPFRGDVKEACAALLVRQLYGELRSSLRADIARRDPGATLAADASVAALIDGRPWLFENLGYHVDISHLQSCVRVASAGSDREVIAMAVEFCDYGRSLARDFQIHERPPFDDFYNDYRILLRALLGQGVDGAARYFTSKADRNGADEDGHHFCGEVLVYLLARVGRPRDAIAAYRKYLAAVPGPLRISPALIDLCRAAGDYEPLLAYSEERGDVLQFTLGLVERARSS